MARPLFGLAMRVVGRDRVAVGGTLHPVRAKAASSCFAKASQDTSRRTPKRRLRRREPCRLANDIPSQCEGL
jgi:hypothetical protein